MERRRDEVLAHHPRLMCRPTLDRSGAVAIMPFSLSRAGVAQLVEYELPKLGVAGSNPVARSKLPASAARALTLLGGTMGIFGKPPDAQACRPAAPTPPRPRRAARRAPSPGAPPRRRLGACVIGAKTTIKGEITGDEDVLVEGNGRRPDPHHAATCASAPGGVGARPPSRPQSVVVSGELIGDCQAATRVEIQATGPAHRQHPRPQDRDRRGRDVPGQQRHVRRARTRRSDSEGRPSR